MNQLPHASWLEAWNVTTISSITFYRRILYHFVFLLRPVSSFMPFLDSVPRISRRCRSGSARAGVRNAP